VQVIGVYLLRGRSYVAAIGCAEVTYDARVGFEVAAKGVIGNGIFRLKRADVAIPLMRRMLPEWNEQVNLIKRADFSA
jgi:hypothetical protein